MSNKRILIALNGLMGLSSFLIVLLLNPHNFWNSPTKIFSATLLSACVGYAPILLKTESPQSTNAGWIASLGVKIFFSGAATLVSIVAVIFACKDKSTASAILDVLSFLGLVSLFGVSRVTEELVTETSERTVFKSSHLIWGDQLELLAHNIDEPTLKKNILDACESTKYLSRDISADQTLENNSINILIQSLSSAISSNDVEQSKKLLDQLKNDFSRREIVLKSARSKA